MKVFIVWRWQAELPFCHSYLEKIFSDKAAADAWCDKLNLENPDPLEEDLYGPVSGCSYHVTEEELSLA